MGPNEIFAAKLSEHRGSSRHSTRRSDSLDMRSLSSAALSERVAYLIFKTQGSASLHPGLRSITPSACSRRCYLLKMP
jgi:hypothetical protein